MHANPVGMLGWAATIYRVLLGPGTFTHKSLLNGALFLKWLLVSNANTASFPHNENTGGIGLTSRVP